MHPTRMHRHTNSLDRPAHRTTPHARLGATRHRSVATVVAYAALVASVGSLASCDAGGTPQTMDVTVGEQTFTCRVSADDASRQKGLGGVASLGPTEGMMFAFPDAAPRNFWMVGCIMDIDIAFIDPLGVVTAVHTMPKEDLQRDGESIYDYEARLKRYPSLSPAQFALEVAPGTLEKLGVKRGSYIEFDRKLLKSIAE